MKHPHLTCLLAALLAATWAAGCASKKYVRTEVGTAETRTAERLTTMETGLEEAQTRLDEHQEQIGEISTTAQEALDRAIAAGKLAEGTFLYETVLNDDAVRFAFDDDALSPEARSALDLFAADLVARNESVFVEIQGHTDSTGPDDYNLRLGERRAEAVRRYLSSSARIPLHRMAVISYGETAPLAGNGSRDDRARNRRVALVVLK